MKNLVRGLIQPYIGAHFDYENQTIKVWKTVMAADAPANPERGKVLSTEDDGIVGKSGVEASRLLDDEPRLYLKTGEYF